jgi:predicted RNA polymerase sigma factor
MTARTPRGALIRALETWPDDPPRDPKAWLVAVAWRKFLDAARAETSRRGRELAVEVEPRPAAPPEARWSGSTAQWRSARPTNRRPASRRWLT